MPIEIEGLERTWTTGRIAPTRRPPFGGKLGELGRTWTTGRIAPTRRPPFGGKLGAVTPGVTTEMVPSVTLKLAGASKTNQPLSAQAFEALFAPFFQQLGVQVYPGSSVISNEELKWVWSKEGRLYTAKVVAGSFRDLDMERAQSNPPTQADSASLPSFGTLYQVTVINADDKPIEGKAGALRDTLKQVKRQLLHGNLRGAKGESSVEVKPIPAPAPEPAPPPAPSPLPVVFGSILAGVIAWNMLQHASFKNRR